MEAPDNHCDEWLADDDAMGLIRGVCVDIANIMYFSIINSKDSCFLSIFLESMLLGLFDFAAKPVSMRH